MVALQFPLLMMPPIGVEVATRAPRAQPQNRLSAVKAPPRPSDLHPVADHVAARAFDDARRNREARLQVRVILDVRFVAFDVVGTGVRRFPRGGGQASARGGPAN